MSISDMNTSFMDGRSNEANIVSLAVLDDNRFISGDEDGLIKIWDKTDPHPRLFPNRADNYPKFISIRNRLSLYALAVFPDKQHFISGGRDSTVTLWKIENPQDDTQKLQTTMVKEYYGNGIVTSLAVLDDNRFIAGYQSGDIILWNINSPSIVAHQRHGTGHVFSRNDDLSVRRLAVLDDNRFISVNIYNAKLWNINDNTIQQVREYRNSWGIVGRATLAVFPDKKHFVIGSKEKINEGPFCIKRWDIDTGIIFKYEQEQSPSISLAVLDNDRFISVLDDREGRKIKLWEKVRQTALYTIPMVTNGGLSNLSVFSDGRYFISSNGREIKLWIAHERSLEPDTKTFFNNKLGNDPSNHMEGFLGTKEGHSFKLGGKRRNKKSNKKKYRKTRHKSRRKTTSRRTSKK